MKIEIIKCLKDNYAYLIIGMDYDTFSSKGGDPFFLKAQKLLPGVP